MYKLIAFSILAVLTAVIQGGVADAAEVKVLASTAMAAVIEEMAPQFERETGHKLAVAIANSATVMKRIGGGEAADVVILTDTGVDLLIKQGKVVSGSRVDIARSSVGVAVRKGVPKPDISTPEALKRTLLAAKSVAYSDPAGGGASGVHFVKVLEHLGIAAEVKAKAKLNPSGTGILVGDIVARGDAEIGVQQIPELVAVSGVDVIGPLPGDLKSVMLLSAGILANSKESEAGKALIRFFTTPASLSVIKAKGLEPPK
jgi:molybdate transport system substrate-binding protein